MNQAKRIEELERAWEPQSLARRFHETYERLAPDYDYKTRTDSAVPWAEVPEKNRRLMVAVCSELAAEALKGCLT